MFSRCSVKVSSIWMFPWALEGGPGKVDGAPELLRSNGSLFRSETELLTVALGLRGHVAQPGQLQGPACELCPRAPHPTSQSLDRCCGQSPERTGEVCAREQVLLSLRLCLGNGRSGGEELLCSEACRRKMGVGRK